MYKHTILPTLDYSGFLLLSLNKADKFEIQKIQNDILRLCNNVRLCDGESIKKLHDKACLSNINKAGGAIVET